MTREELAEALDVERFTYHRRGSPDPPQPRKTFEVMVYDPAVCAERLRGLAEDLGIDTWLSADAR